MASSFEYESLRDIELTRDEVDKLGTALKDEEFRKLLVDYVEELKDPENRKIFQQEITELEKERGNDVTFINPAAGYVIKTSVNGSKKAFINICASEHVKKPTSAPAVQDGCKGLQWSLPHTLASPREDIDKQGVRCEVYDVVFHPDTLYLAQNNKAFYNMVNSTACEAVESNFDVKLDCKNLKFPKMQYKGMPQATVIRKPSNEKPPPLSPEEQSIMDKVFKSIPKPEEKSPMKTKACKKTESDTNSNYTTPKYIIKHRSHIELEEFTEHKTAKINTTIPRELVLEVKLPLLKSADNIVLDVNEKTVQLTSEKPAKYKLNLTLPYSVNQDCGNAKFDKNLKTLTVTLPVQRSKLCTVDVNHDSGVESDHGSPVSSSLTENALLSVLTESSASENFSDVRTNAFLDNDIHYILPEHSCHMYENILTFTLHVKNVDESSLQHVCDPHSFHVKFSSIGSGFYSTHYAFYIGLPENTVDAENVTAEVWDNNIIAQVPFKPCDNFVTSYFVGIDDTDSSEKYIEEPAIVNSVLENLENYAYVKGGGVEEPSVSEMATADNDSEECEIHTKVMLRKPNNLKTVSSDGEDCLKKGERKYSSKAIDIFRAFSESSSDDLSYSYSPSKCKGILKRFSSARSSVSRSISESSIDDVLWASSFENCYTSLDSVIPEDGEVSRSLKKTVRFNDVVSRQLYRSNSSILGQKKKNQRKARNKKRAQERRHSESEVCELEDRRERELKTNDVEENDKEAVQTDDEKEEKNGNDIFYLDM